MSFRVKTPTRRASLLPEVVPMVAVGLSRGIVICTLGFYLA
jgi:hypothetical protein